MRFVYFIFVSLISTGSLFAQSNDILWAHYGGGALYISYSGDGRILAPGYLDARTGNPTKTRGYDPGDLFAVSYTDSFNIGATEDGQIQLGFLDTFVTLQNDISDSNDCNPLLAFSPTDTIIASAIGIDNGYSNPHPDPRNLIKLWSVNGHSEIREFHSPGFSAPKAIAFSSDGSKIAAYFPFRDTLIVWNTEDGSILYKVPRIYGNNQIFFLPGDTSIFFSNGLTYCLTTKKSTSINVPGAINGAIVCLMPEKRSIAVVNNAFDVKPPDTVYFVDLATGAIRGTILLPDSEFVYSMAVNPVTGDVAIAGQDLIVYKAPSFLSVKDEPLPESPLQVFELNSKITIQLPNDAGKLYIYRSDGRCYYSANISFGTASVTTPELPMGDYFVVFQPEVGEKSIAKISLFH